MTKEELKQMLIEQGYTTFHADDEDKQTPEGWYAKHDGCLYKEFDETEVAFQVNEDNGCSVWLSIKEQDARLETNVKDLQAINMLLGFFDAETLKVKHYDYIIH